MNISIIIPTVFSRPLFMDDLLESISRQSIVKCMYEVILVDNNIEAKDELKHIVVKWNKDLPIKLIHVPKNGLHNARHAGAEAASGSLLIYVDDDVRMPSTWLSSFEQFFNSSDVICAGGRVLPEWAVQPPEWLTALPVSIFSLLDYGDSVIELDSKQGVNGCNFAICKDALFRYGGFHPDGFSDPSKRWLRGDGEYGLIQKLKAGGERVYYLPSASLYHRIPASRMEVKSVDRLFQNHGISWAYRFTRKYHCSFAALTALVSYGWLMSFIMRLGSVILDRSVVKIREFYVTRYRAYAKYGYHLFRDAQMRKYVQQKSYLED
jgi:glycosyltransferase involved in cell wall biosynthesis